jgi:hypothetical protein
MSHPPGFYKDPFGVGSTRWWDGAKWTFRVLSPPGAPGPSRIETNIHQLQGKLRKASDQTLVADTRRIAVGETVFDLDEIDSVAFWRVPKTARNAPIVIMITACCVLTSKGEELFFTWAGWTSVSHEMATFESLWFRLIGILSATVMPRLAGQIVAAVRAGEMIEVAGVKVGPNGLIGRNKMRRPVEVSWPSVAGTNIGDEYITVLGSDSRGRPPVRRFSVLMSRPNAVLLPTIIDQLGRQN